MLIPITALLQTFPLRKKLVNYGEFLIVAGSTADYWKGSTLSEASFVNY